MQFARLNEVNLHHQLIGGPPSKPTLVFVNSLGTDFRMWRDVVVRLVGEATIITYDKRGHGLSGVGRTPYSMETLASDLAALLDHLRVRNAIICGVSVGGMIAQQLYALRPDLVEALALCDTLPRIGDHAFWSARIARIEAEGLGGVAEGILERWFTPEFRRPDNAEYIGYLTMFERQPVEGYLATCAALRDADLGALAPHIGVPTLCVVGDRDMSIPAAAVADFARAIPHARFELIRACGHLPSVEQPEALTAILRAFMSLVATETASHVSH
jgi:3-oxoadipate enol-lactonase